MQHRQKKPPKPPATSRLIYCCGCATDVTARLTDGKEIYPHRPDLAELPMWICDGCKMYVGCHHKTKDPTRPTGVIPTREISDARKHIHALLDPLWRSGLMTRVDLYALVSLRIGREYHTGEIRSLEEARDVYRIIREIARQYGKRAA